MSKFKYVGDARFKEVNEEKVDMAPPPFTTVFGIDFELDGEAKEVPDEYVHKFRGNQTFEEVFDDVVDEPAPEPEPEPEPQKPAAKKKGGRPRKKVVGN